MTACPWTGAETGIYPLFTRQRVKEPARQRKRGPVFTGAPLLTARACRLVIEAYADAEHAADHVVKDLIVVLRADIGRTDVGEIFHPGVELSLGRVIPVQSEVEVEY